MRPTTILLVALLAEEWKTHTDCFLYCITLLHQQYVLKMTAW